MKNRFFPLAAIALLCGASVMTSCDSDTLSSRLAENALEEHPLFVDSSQVVTFQTGYYEVTNETELKQLEKAGMITCKFENVIEKKWHRGYFRSPGVVKEIPHTFASVELTPAGKKLEVTLRHDNRSYILKALKVNKPEEKKQLPDYMNIGGTNESEVEVLDNVMDGDAYDEAPEEAEEYESEQDKYRTSLSKINVVSHEMLVCKTNIIDAFDVFCPEEYVKNGKGTCKFIYEFVDPTPFGHVLTSRTFNKPQMGVATFEHTTDNGWVVSHTELR